MAEAHATDSGSTKEDVKEEEIPVDRLPHEVLLRVFLLLDMRTIFTVVQRVCRHWSIVASDLPQIQLDFATLPKSAGFRLADDPTRAQMVVNMVRRFPRAAVTLNTSGYVDLSPGFVTAVAAQCPRLTEFKAQACAELDEVAANALGVCCPKITTIDLSACHGISDTAIESLLGLLPRLHALDASHLPSIVNPDLESAATRRACLLRGEAGEPQRTWSTESAVPVDTVPARTVSQGDTHGARGLVPTLPLRKIDLTRCDLLSNRFVFALARHCPRLTSVTLDWCVNLMNDCVIALVENCLHLVEVSLCGNQRLTDESVLALAQHCPNLTTAHLGWLWRLTEKSYTELGQRCRRLVSVDWSGCDHLTDKSVAALAEGNPQLRSVMLNWCGGLTDIGVIALAENCPNMASISLTNCHALTEKSSRALSKHCPLLTAEVLTGCGLRSAQTANTPNTGIRPMWV